MGKRHILIKREMAIGDVIWVTPLIEHFAVIEKCEVSVMTSRKDPLENNPFINEIYDYEYMPNDEEIIDLDNSYESQRNKHILASYYFTAKINNPSFFRPTLYPTFNNYNRVLDKISRLFSKDKLITIHCSATSIFRIWPRDRWNVLINTLNELNIGIILVGANADYSFEENENIVNLVGCTDFLDSAAVISLSDLFIGGDSGMSHVAFAMNIPAIVLYNLVSPEFRMPYASYCKPIVSNSNGCRFCMNNCDGIYRCDNKITPECMLNISLNEVINSAYNIISNIPSKQFINKIKLFNK